MFPFQSLNNFELQNMFSTKTDVMRQLNKLDCLEALDSNLNLINVNSKYRSGDWLNRHYDTYNDLGISVIHVYVRSITTNKQKIEELLHDLNKSPHIIAISETRLNDDSNLGQANIQGYNLLNVNSNSNAGGVALYVSQKLNYFRKPELSLVSPDSKNLFVEISLDKKAKGLLLGVIYRHPQNNFTTFQEQYCKLLNQLSYEKRNYIICGDINIDIFSANHKSTISNYLNELYSVTCCNIINIPTIELMTVLQL